MILNLIRFFLFIFVARMVLMLTGFLADSLVKLSRLKFFQTFNCRQKTSAVWYKRRILLDSFQIIEQNFGREFFWVLLADFIIHKYWLTKVSVTIGYSLWQIISFYCIFRHGVRLWAPCLKQRDTDRHICNTILKASVSFYKYKNKYK